MAQRVVAPPSSGMARAKQIEALAAKGQGRSAKDTADLLNLIAGQVVADVKSKADEARGNRGGRPSR